MPVNFLAVRPGTEFLFALAPRRNARARRKLKTLLSWARSCLGGALCDLGTGAKTAAGYGVFQLSSPATTPPARGRRRVWTGALQGAQPNQCEALVRLQLVSPAFLGGADRHAQETPRLSSVRGLLRSWWRAWHGHFSTRQLRELEAVTFGSIKHGAGLALLPAKRHELRIVAAGKDMGGGGSPLGYLGYGPIGYDSQLRKTRTLLNAIDVGQVLEVRLVHRSEPSLQEALKSLWLMAASAD